MGTLQNWISKLALRSPLFWLAIAAAIGIMAVDQHWSWVICGLVLISAFFKRRRPSVILVIGMLLTSFVFGWVHLQRISEIKSFPLLRSIAEKGGPVYLSGKGWLTTDTRQRTGQSLRAVLQLNQLTIKGTEIDLPNRDRVVALINHRNAEELQYGSEISFSGRLEKIDKAKSPGAFDPEKYFFRSANAVAELNINTGDQCVATGEFKGSKLRRLAIHSRETMERALAHGISKHKLEMNGVILAMALGAREKSPDDVEDFFRLSGTMHIFAVSGLHVGVVAGMIWFLLKWIGLSKRQAALIIIPVILFYALLTGLRPSSFRAAVMLSALLAGFALKQRPSPVNGIGLAALVLLGLNSQQLFLPGFQLSFCVVLALSVVGTWLSNKIHHPFRIDDFIPPRRAALWRRRTDTGVRLISSGLGISAASWLGSVALMNSHFSGISPIGLVANIVMVPIASMIVIIAGISILFYSIKLGILSFLLNNLNLYLTTFLAFLAQMFSDMPGAHLHTGSEKISNQSDVVSLDVMGLRGGNSVLASSSGNHWMLDSGGNLTFRQQVLPMLRSRGINHLDCLILTHGDSGHVGAAPYLLNHLTPDLVIETEYPNRARVYSEINEIIEKRGIDRFQVTAGQKLKFSENFILEPIYPGKASPPTGVADDRCLVLRMRSGKWRLLFTFDIGFLVEKQLIKDDWYLDSDIWIRGQHSSTISGTDEFMRKVDPKLIISTNCRFPPHEKLSSEWVDNVDKSGAKLITLDEAGTVNLLITNESITIDPFLGDKIVITK